MRLAIFLITLATFSLCSAQNLAELELKLKDRLTQLRNAKSNTEINKLNSQFTKEMGEFLKKEGAYEFEFTQLPTVADLKSEDGLVRIVHWNLEYSDFSYSYAGFILHRDP
jgi:hypothetical protein